MPQPLLPLKVVFPARTDYYKPTPTGRGFEPVQAVTAEFRQRLAQQVDQTGEAFKLAFSKWDGLPAVATVVLNKAARNKSHRPSEIFNPATCPIIGARGSRELLISVTPKSLERVRDSLQSTTKRSTAHISTIDNILPFKAEEGVDDLGKEPLRVRLARHTSAEANRAIDTAFEEMVVGTFGAEVEELDYGPALRIYKVAGLDQTAVNVIRRDFANLQSISPFPTYGVVRTAANALRPMTDDVFGAARSDVIYGVVGVIDSGTDPDNSALQSWVLSRDEHWVPREVQNNDHGSFVAGLIANARRLNHGDSRFPGCSAKIVDVVAFDRDGQVSEPDLLRIIDDALLKFPDVRVWNLSLALQGDPCQDCEVSELASALDARSERHNVLFVIAAGNMLSPFRRWPPEDGVDLDDRIRPPADAVRGLTVGGLAHVETAGTLSPRECPSPFGRRGPGVAGTMKPDLSHYAGNIDSRGSFIQSGIMSLDGSGNIAEDVGTSFSAPLVSAVAAAAYCELETPDAAPSILQVKAMLLHSVFVHNAPVDPGRIGYCGAGRLGDLSDILNCTQSSATVVMNVSVSPNNVFEKNPFPMPTCLVKNGVLRGEMFMTVLADCPVDRRFALEYCRTNVTASLGTLHPTRKTKSGAPEYCRQLESALAPGYEADEDVLGQGFRWSPLKFYYRKFVSGPNQQWRLRVRAMNRAEHYEDTPQNVSILLTIKSDVETDTVYDELVVQMQQHGWNVVDLPLRSRVRGRNR